ncbi:F-box protein CPR1-like [Mercurialis annua]|uniref:F-box protein CPR1-like n=1 Tax=Mercurialis annua TaxID=3986 RepID=UPI00215F12C0|nr:F-box protein CPR1-like [Mercurialis annua]
MVSEFSKYLSVNPNLNISQENRSRTIATSSSSHWSHKKNNVKINIIRHSLQHIHFFTRQISPALQMFVQIIPFRNRQPEIHQFPSESPLSNQSESQARSRRLAPRGLKPLVKTPDNFIPVNPDGVFGSCNGVVAMYNKEGITLLNPSTNRFKSFPLWIVDILYNGFGYDPISDDYKVVMVTKLFSEEFLRVMIYSVKNNSLRRIQDLHSPEPNWYRYNYEYSGILVGSFLHWVASPRYDECCSDGSVFYNFILAFDLRDETFREVPLPLPLPRDTRDGDSKELNMVSELGGCLSLSYCFRGYVEIWIMKEYGIEDSWTKLLSCHENLNYSSGLKPLCYSKEDDKVLMDYDKGKELILYDLTNQTSDIINISESSKFNKKTYGVCKSGVVCATTLTFPNVNGGSSNICKKLPRKKNNKKV